MATEASLSLALAELARVVLDVEATTVNKFDDSVEEHLAKIDDISLTIDSLRAEVSKTADDILPMLMKESAELQALYAVIDRAEAAVNRVQNAAKIVSDRMDILQKGYDVKHPEGLSKIASWFGGSQRQTIDAPISLPPFDNSQARISAATEIHHIAECIGTLPARTHAGQDAVESQEHQTAAAVDAAATQEKPTDVVVGDVAEFTKATSPVRVSAITTGEEEEEEEEDE